MTDPIPSAPAGLSIDARKLWVTYAEGWVLDEHAQTVLRLACETLDRMLAAQRQIKRQGYRPLPKGSPNPYTVERDCRRDLLKMLRGLGLSLDALPDGLAPKERRS
jgi:phage terminase small subunit